MTHRQQIRDHYRAAIADGTLPPGERLPTYAQLAAEWNVSRSTMQEAMHDLRRDGLLEFRGRQGTYVSEAATLTVLDWETIGQTVAQMHDQIESEYAPEVVLTMSGPGSFAAWLALSMNKRYVPVLSAVTFPAGGGTSQSEKAYRQAAKLDTLTIIETDKWHVYLPRTLGRYPEGTRVLIFDDRVISGTTQRLASEFLTSVGRVVRTAAMIVGTNNTDAVDYHGLVIDDNYRLPWGTKRGRT